LKLLPSMKKVEIWLNESQYKEFVRKAKLKGLTRYALLKQIALRELDKY